MSVVSRPLMYADLRNSPVDNNLYEIVDRGLIASPAPPRLHEKLIIRLLLLNHAYLVREQLGDDIFTAPVDVRLTEHTVVQPDVFFVTPERRHSFADSGLVDGAPDRSRCQG